MNIVERTKVLFVILETKLCFCDMCHKATKDIHRPREPNLCQGHPTEVLADSSEGSPAWYFGLDFSTFRQLLEALPCFCSTLAFTTLAVLQLLDIPALPSVGLWLPLPGSSRGLALPALSMAAILPGLNGRRRLLLPQLPPAPSAASSQHPAGVPGFTPGAEASRVHSL